MATSIDALADAVVAHLDGLPTPDLVGVGEPTHGEPALLAYGQRVLDRLIDRGVRSVVLETDAVAALVLDDWVRGGPGSLDDVLRRGLTHEFGERAGMREFVARLRVRNDERPPAERVSVHGCDLAGEMVGQPGPRRELEHLHRFLAATLDPARLPVTAAELDRLLGDDAPWATWEAQTDAAHSVGATPAAVALRAVADDLVAVLHAEAPRLVAATSRGAWRRAELHGRAALALLRYHAVAARPVDAGDRLSWLTGARDEAMARHLLALRAHERERGPTLVLAHDAHLQRVRSTWRLGSTPIGWSSAGAVVDAVGGERYVHVAAVLGAGGARALDAPPPGSLEAALAARADAAGLVTDTGGLAEHPVRDDVDPQLGYLPLDGAAVGDADAVVVLDRPDPAPTADPSVRDLATGLLARPGVTHLRADEAAGAPAVAHGHWFLYADGDARMPFATIVTGDYPGHDEASRLDREGVFRLNLTLGRAALADVVDPDAAPDDLDRFVAHPVYGTQGWVAILCPSAARLPVIDRLVATALARARRGRTGSRPTRDRRDPDGL